MFSRTKKLAQQTAQRLVSGHLTLIAWWTLKNAGLFDAILKIDRENPDDSGLELLVHATRTSMAPDVLYALVQYLETSELLAVNGDRASLTPAGRALLEHEDSLLETIRSYQPILAVVEHMLAKLKIPGGAATRRKSETLADAQAQRLAPELFPALQKLIAQENLTHLLDLTCGTGDLLVHLAQQIKQAVGVGLSTDGTLARHANDAFTAAQLEKRLIAVPANPMEVIASTKLTFERIGISRQLWSELDCLIAVNLFAEHVVRTDLDPTAQIAKALGSIPKHFPKARFLLVEPTASPRFDKNYYAPELSLLMRLTKSPLFPVEEWRRLFKEAKLTLLHEEPLQIDGMTLFHCKS